MTNQELESAILSTLAIGSRWRSDFVEDLAFAIDVDWIRISGRIERLMTETRSLRPVLCRWRRSGLVTIGVR